MKHFGSIQRIALSCLLCLLLVCGTCVPAFANAGSVYSNPYCIQGPFSIKAVSNWDFGDGQIGNGSAIWQCAVSAWWEVAIPTEGYNGYPVVEIMDYAFFYCEDLRYILVHNGVTSIGEGAFNHCTSLLEFTVPKYVASIEANTFKDCVSLESVTIPEGVTSIGAYAFKDCASLTSLHIPSSVTSIDATAFDGCANLELCSYRADSPAAAYAAAHSNVSFRQCGDAVDGIWHYHVEHNEVTITGCDEPEGNLTIPSALAGYPVTAIGDGVFAEDREDDDYLTGISIPNTVRRIGDSAFDGCCDLTDIEIPSGVVSIGQYAFRGTGLTSVTFPTGSFILGDGAFEGTWFLAVNLSLPGGCIMGKWVFNYSGITGLTLGSGITSISTAAFQACEHLSSVTLPDTLTTIGSGAFALCSLLESITIPESVRMIDYAAFSGTAISSVVIPSNVASIGSGAFEACPNLTSVSIQQGVRSIAETAFASCNIQGEVHIPTSVTEIGYGAFYGCPAICSPISDGAAAAYAAEVNANEFADDDITFIVCNETANQLNVTIDDQIGVNFQLDLDAYDDPQTVTLTYKDASGQTVTEEYAAGDLPQMDNGLYYLTVNIAPAQLSDTLTVSFQGVTLTKTIKEYCTQIVNGNYSADYKAVAQAMLQYGEAARQFFQYSGDTITDISGLSAATAASQSVTFHDETSLVRKISFLALTQPQFRFYMQQTLTEEQAVAYNDTMTVAYTEGDTPSSLTARFAMNSQGEILIEVLGIRAEDMNRTVEITIGALNQKITFKGNDFAVLLARNTSTATLGAALYNYCTAAQNCQGA